jgi:hypothetical protein
MSRLLHTFVLSTLLGSGLQAQTPDEILRPQAIQALKLAAEYFQFQVAVHGTYLWEYSLDLSQREGEGVADSDQGWIQPPGTPAIGQAFLQSFEATGDAYYLQAAQTTAHGLVQGQLRSGGWYYYVHFDKSHRDKLAYRTKGNPQARNVTTLDDDTTQAALRFLMKTDQALGFRDPIIHESIEYALDHLLQAQYPNGAWPQGFSDSPEPGKFPVRPAAYPEAWPRSWPGSREYWRRYTFNDNVLADMIATMFLAESVYHDPSESNQLKGHAMRCREAAEKAGDFILLAQMPEPQPAWAQQYDFEMHPCWARKFEPPAVTGGESQGVLRTLLDLYRHTGKSKYLEPLPGALAYLERSRLPDGSLARFYELQSNKPLYFTRDYQLTYNDQDVPTHYSFKTSNNTAAIRREYQRLLTLPPGSLPLAERSRPLVNLPALRNQVNTALQGLDKQGRWVEQGPLRYHRPKNPSLKILRSSTYIRHVQNLCSYLMATGADDKEP